MNRQSKTGSNFAKKYQPNKFGKDSQKPQPSLSTNGRPERPKAPRQSKGPRPR
jgi:hypothetical protein